MISTYPLQAFVRAWSKVSLNIKIKVTLLLVTMYGLAIAQLCQVIKIGYGAIIGADSLITKDVMPYSIVGGNPAKIIREKFDDKTMEFLLDLQW